MKKLNRRSRLALYLAASVLALVSPVSSLFAQTVWTDGTGNWFNAGNWSAGVPGSSTAAQINNGGTAQITASGAQAGDVTLGLGSSDSGTLSISGPGDLNATLHIGESGIGVVTISNGGSGSGGFIMGDNAGSSGTATVSGSGSTWTTPATCFVGFNGNGSLSITDGGSVSATATTIAENAGSTSTVSVDGTGSTWNSGNLDAVGGNGSGALMVTNGGSVSSGVAVVGRNPGSQGSVTVDGIGSSWTASGTLAIGDNGGAGTLNITNGATVSSSEGHLAGGNGSTATVTVDGAGSTWENSDPHAGQLYVGASGSSAMLSITNGGKVSNSDGYIGFGGTGSGTVIVDGTGSTWTNSGNLYVGGSNTGPGVTGILRIQNGGTVKATATTVWSPGTLEIGLSPTLNGTLAFKGGTLRTLANTSFAKNASLGTGGATVDSNNFNSTLSGTITGIGSFAKINTGTITLSGANTYTGGTTVSDGTLLVNNTAGSGTGTAAVQVSAGTLGGTGTIAGAVTIGNGTGADAFISPGTSVGTLTIQKALTLSSDATFKFELNSSSALADKIVANGVTISGAKFSFSDLGAGHLTSGTSFVVIDNTSSAPITGFFSNLADNSTFTNKGNTYLVSYEGGTGNDLTIKVVPEPSVWQLLCIATVLLFVGTKISLLSRALR
jgi:T5SS/PEP-CTERM-associated repeat protein/autotransporter-associated beta strand protein